MLSGEADIACATCHHPDFSCADGRHLALGTRASGPRPERVDLPGGEIPVLERNTPAVFNIAFNGVERMRRRANDDDVPGPQAARGRLSGQFRGLDNMSERETADIVALS